MLRAKFKSRLFNLMKYLRLLNLSGFTRWLMLDHQHSLKHPTYRADIDGLRAIAVLSVVGFHVFPGRVNGGFVGVDIFFVISGFLISGIIFNNLYKDSFSFGEFYARRIRRIFPALILVMAASYAFGWYALLPDDFKQLGKHMVGGAGFISNLFFWKEAGYFDSTADKKPLLHLWSLGIEEQFYIVWPLLIYLAWKRKFNLLTLLIVILGISFSQNIAKVHGDPVQAFYSPVTRFWELSIGSVLALITLQKKDIWHSARMRIDSVLGKIIFSTPPTQEGVVLRESQSLLGAFLIGIAILKTSKDYAFPGWWALLPAVGAFLIIAAGPSAWFNRAVLSHRVMVWFGLISFPLYLWHWPILAFCKTVSPNLLANPGMLEREIKCLIVFAAIALAWLTYKFVERPIRFGERAKEKIIVLLVLMGAIGYAGYITYQSNGFPSRFSQEIMGLLNQPDFKFKDAIRVNKCDITMLTEEITPTNTNPRAAECIETARPLVLLWGDSHASALYPGLKHLQEQKKFGIAQLSQSACPPLFDFIQKERPSCEFYNNWILDIAKEIRPEIILLNASWWNPAYPDLTTDAVISDIELTINKLKKELPSSRIIVVGPVPQWEGSLKLSMFNYYRFSPNRALPPEYMQFGQRGSIQKLDRTMSQTVRMAGVRYISAYDSLCNEEGCLTRVGSTATDLTAIDYGHLSPAGSRYLLDRIGHDIFEDLSEVP